MFCLLMVRHHRQERDRQSIDLYDSSADLCGPSVRSANRMPRLNGERTRAALAALARSLLLVPVRHDRAEAALIATIGLTAIGCLDSGGLMPSQPGGRGGTAGASGGAGGAPGRGGTTDTAGTGVHPPARAGRVR